MQKIFPLSGSSCGRRDWTLKTKGVKNRNLREIEQIVLPICSCSTICSGVVVHLFTWRGLE